jgi:CheY-like chemotaxis protein
VFNADPKALQRIAPLARRVMVIDSNANSARLVGELMKAIGSREFATVLRGDRALATVNEFEPQLILTELAGPGFDGLEFTRALRRSPCVACKAPVIMITAEPTAAAILGARNAGVHEFLRKPYTAGDLYRRVENVVLKPRTWIDAQAYVGPDRRRFNSCEFAGSKKRRSDAFKPEFAEQAG